MYVCFDCHNTFDLPKEYVENHGFINPPFEIWSSCPYCGSGNYGIPQVCKYCGNIILNGYCILPDGSVMCEECFNDIEKYNFER